MLSPGTAPPEFSLPAAVDGEIRRVSLSDSLGEAVVVLAFYPADFSPACTEALCSLRDIDLLGLQKDVQILGLSTDTAFSHRAFAEAQGIGFPLLSDNDGSVAEAYGVLQPEGIAGHRRLARRAVFVVDVAGRINYTWLADDPGELPAPERIRTAIDAAADDEGAVEWYRVGHEAYATGLDPYRTGHEHLEGGAWTRATDAFERAFSAFDEAAAAFETSHRFAEDERIAERATIGRETAVDYRHAAKWFARAAEEHDRGDAAMAEEFAGDARSFHAAATDGEGPPAPAEIDPSA